MGLRITSGVFKGRILKTPPSSITRPTQEKVRQAIFNMLQNTLEDAIFVDVYAGSGAMGFEALSRGAKHVYCIENHKAACDIIRQNITLLDCDAEVTVLKGDAKKMLHRIQDADIVFCDPPYGSEKDDFLFLSTLKVETLLAPDGIILYETTHSLAGDGLEKLSLIDARTFGDTVVNVLKRKEPL